ncbi:MAG TPA: AMP-binding protein, partial [Dehalococcoidia bacterium]|nr:AMP-binding protein [Dehalococcoidia bacterium]
MAGLTLPQQLVDNSRRFGATGTALRHKRLGIWESYSWLAYHDQVRDLALGLAALGLERGQVVLLLGDNHPLIYVAHLAVQSLGGCSLPVHPVAGAAEIGHWARATGAVAAICTDQEHLDQADDAGAPASLRWIIADIRHEVLPRSSERFTDLIDLIARGRETARTQPDAFSRLVDQGGPGDLAAIVSTGGAGGVPRGIQLTHGQILAAARALAQAEGVSEQDELLAFLPIGWIVDVELSLALPLVTGCTVACPEAPETLEENLREIGPTVMYAPPHFWRTLMVRTKARLTETKGVKGWLSRKILREAEAGSGQGRRTDWIGETLRYGPLRDQLGLSQIRRAYSGGLPTDPAIFRFYRTLGVDLNAAYSLTECGGLAAVGKGIDGLPGSIGPVLPGLEVRIGDAGDILLKGESVSLASLGAGAGGTQEWLQTGDAGAIDPNVQVRWIERWENLGALADGTHFTPTLIEQILMSSPYVSRAVVFGSQRSEVTAAVCIDTPAVGNWAQRRGHR